eukprot:COSAG06_NODE_1407_length_9550_cov_1.910380_4_plen_83_part_00
MLADISMTICLAELTRLPVPCARSGLSYTEFKYSRLVVPARGKITRPLRHFILKMIILPRQARDKHSESSKNESFSCSRPLR